MGAKLYWPGKLRTPPLRSAVTLSPRVAVALLTEKTTDKADFIDPTPAASDGRTSGQENLQRAASRRHLC